MVSTESFDEKAATWDLDPAKVERAQAVGRAIRAAVPLDTGMRLLEYGAGTGLVTEALRDTVGPVTMADTSEGMREAIHAKIEAGIIPDARVWDLDLTVDPVPDERFDVIVTVMALHHVTDLGRVLSGFARLLVEGGHLCVVDLREEDGSFHGPDFAGHQGFEPYGLAARLAEVGFGEVTVEDCYSVVRGGRTYPLFLAVGLRDRTENPPANARR